MIRTSGGESPGSSIGFTSTTRKTSVCKDARQGDDEIEIDLALDKFTMEIFGSVFSQLDP